jgi:hypothetical protein
MLYRERAAWDRRLRRATAGVVVVLLAAAVLVPMLVVLLAVVALGSYATLRSPLLDRIWVGDDVDDWA